jgi:hypothetical protein
MAKFFKNPIFLEYFLGAFCYKGIFILFKSTQKDGYFDTQHDPF